MPWEYHPQKRSPWVWVSDADTAQSAATAQLAGPAPRRAADSPAAPETTRLDQFQHIRIQGSKEFIAATKEALRALRATPSWRYALGLSEVVQSHRTSKHAGGHIRGGVFTVFDDTWREGTAWYASVIAHDGQHALDGDAYGTEAERRALAVQEQALRELGGSDAEISYVKTHKKNPTHHIGWAEEWARAQ